MGIRYMSYLERHLAATDDQRLKLWISWREASKERVRTRSEDGSKACEAYSKYINMRKRSKSNIALHKMLELEAMQLDLSRRKTVCAGDNREWYRIAGWEGPPPRLLERVRARFPSPAIFFN